MKIRSLVMGFGVLLAMRTWAQVPNDDCTNATPFLMFTGGCTVWDGNPGLFWSGDSINAAISNFPYPANPNPCSGYASSVATPANDRWYVLPNNGATQLRLSFECSDTCHVSWWRGVCGMLQPMQCYTLVPNLEHAMEPFATSTATDTFYMQISGNGNPEDFAYHACVRLNPVAGDPIPVTEPTPVICFTYDITIVPASAPEETDGSIAITMAQGTPPHSIMWMDGDTTFERMDLVAGEYIYTITDASGCAETDTVEVDYQVSTGTTSPEVIKPSVLTPGPEPGTISINWYESTGAAKVSVHDMMGRLLFEQQLPTTGIVIAPSNEKTQLVIVSISSGERTHRQKILLSRP